MSSMRLIHEKIIHILVTITIVLFLFNYNVLSQSLDIPSRNWGISFGNSTEFSGFRINYRDHNVEKIRGINITLWDSYDNELAEVTGISLGIMPQAGYLKGLQLGIAGIAAERELSGVSLGLLGGGSGGDINGIGFGGLGFGSGGSMSGLFIGGLGVGCGKDISGIMIGGLGAGAGGSMSGFSLGILGVGAGHNVSGITIGGLGAGAGEKISGITIGGLGAGAPAIRGLTIAGLGVGGTDIKGVSLALGSIRIEDESGEGSYSGLAASAFNYIKGEQTGVSLGIVNYAYQLNGFQIGLINYVRDNPDFLKILPLINFNF
ncbi:LA_2272 family surface repeat-containing protein [Calditrichota bacterium]